MEEDVKIVEKLSQPSPHVWLTLTPTKPGDIMSTTNPLPRRMNPSKAQDLSEELMRLNNLNYNVIREAHEYELFGSLHQFLDVNLGTELPPVFSTVMCNFVMYVLQSPTLQHKAPTHNLMWW